MTLPATALVTLAQAKAFCKIDSAAALHVDAEYVGLGTGLEKSFSLDHAPLEGTLKLYVNGTLQIEGTDFTISGTAITFVNAPSINYPITAAYDYAATADTFESYDDLLLETLINAATKKAEDYCERRFITRTETEYHHGDGTRIIRLYRRPVNSIISVHYQRSQYFTGDGLTCIFPLAELPDNVEVYINGTLKTVTADYTVSGQAVTFVTAPADGAHIVFKYFVEMKTVMDFSEWLSIGRLQGAWLNSYVYKVVYSVGYGADRDTVQPILPEAVSAVLVAVANWWNNRLGVRSENQQGIGSVDYGDAGELPPLSKKLLRSLKV